MAGEAWGVWRAAEFLWATPWVVSQAKQGSNLDGDIAGNGIVDMAELKALAFHWLKDCE
jgi:hypothetical protein